MIGTDYKLHQAAAVRLDSNTIRTMKSVWMWTSASRIVVHHVNQMMMANKWFASTHLARIDVPSVSLATGGMIMVKCVWI